MSGNRGSKPGEKRGGRQKGTPNKRTLAVTDKLAALGCDPIQRMAQIAMNEEVEVTIRARLLTELAQYIAPKRKAVEVTGEDGGPLALEISWQE
jgi:hypothetical protein